MFTYDDDFQKYDKGGRRRRHSLVPFTAHFKYKQHEKSIARALVVMATLAVLYALFGRSARGTVHAHFTSQRCLADAVARPLVPRLATVEEMQAPHAAALFAQVFGAQQPLLMHRKHWEFIFLFKALKKLNMLKKGTKGLVFAVGEEVTVPALAALKM